MYKKSMFLKVVLLAIIILPAVGCSPFYNEYYREPEIVIVSVPIFVPEPLPPVLVHPHPEPTPEPPSRYEPIKKVKRAEPAPSRTKIVRKPRSNSGTSTSSGSRTKRIRR